MQVLENFRHADTFVQMSMSEKLLATGYVILLGMGITFIALILIWVITMLMSKIIKKFETKKTGTVETPRQNVSAQSIGTPQAASIIEEDADELIAVISAAIAASLNTSMHNIIVKNIRRVPDNTPVWGKTGRSEVMNVRF